VKYILKFQRSIPGKSNSSNILNSYLTADLNLNLFSQDFQIQNFVKYNGFSSMIPETPQIILSNMIFFISIVSTHHKALNICTRKFYRLRYAIRI